jgi:hypothetical protein
LLSFDALAQGSASLQVDAQSIPIIAVTSYALSGGDYVPKPFSRLSH